MAARRRIKELSSVRITRVDARGRGRGVFVLPDGGERLVAVTGALPGDVVDIRVRRRKAGTIVGEIQQLVGSTRRRRKPFCRHFGACGGCTTQELPYPEQLRLKEAMVRAAFQDAGFPDAADPRDRSADCEIPPSVFRAILPSEQERYYRNKLEYSFGAQRWLTDEEVRDGVVIEDRRGLGFHAPGRFDRVLDISECYLQPEPSGSIRTFLREFTREQNLTFYDAREHHGLLRLLIIRTALTGESMVTVMFGEEDQAQRELVMSALAERFPGINSLNYVINTSNNDSLFPHEVVLWRGTPWITERCGSNHLRIRPKAFYQTNPAQAVRLYQAALELVGLEPMGATGETPSSVSVTGDEQLVFDLYSGIGSIALFLARRVSRVIGIEAVSDAVRAARENAELNGIENVVFEEGEVEKVLPAVVERHGKPTLVIVDPPRAGLHPAVRRVLVDLAPDRIVYISCNPRTQATDIRDFVGTYIVTHVQPVDMFPQTRHVENIVVLRRRVAEAR